MGKSNNLDDFLADLADAIREKKGTSEPINAQDFSSEITSIKGDIWGFDTIGYTPQNSPIDEWVAYSAEQKRRFENGEITSFKGDKDLVFAPNIDTSNKTTLSEFFYGCSRLVSVKDLDLSKSPKLASFFNGCSSLIDYPQFDTSHATSIGAFFYNCTNIREVTIDASNATDIGSLFQRCSSLKKAIVKNSTKAIAVYSLFNECSSLEYAEFDVGGATNVANFLNNCSKLVFLKITNLGKSTLATYDFSRATAWGTGGEENRQSLIDSLITYSYDRASNGMATATIKLSANTKALLTDDEIAQITAKGFTIS